VARIAGWTPFRELDAIERRLRRMLQDIGLVSALLPAADAYETADEFVVELEVPGYDEKELSIEISDHALKVTGERTATRDEAEKRFRLRERLEHKFERRFQLPPEADTGTSKRSSRRACSGCTSRSGRRRARRGWRSRNPGPLRGLILRRRPIEADRQKRLGGRERVRVLERDRGFPIEPSTSSWPGCPIRMIQVSVLA
jgi:HSP20 family protein